MVVLALFFLMIWAVGVYNFGYVFAAKVLGYRINEFSIGYGPKLAGFTLGNTHFTLRILPLGGYVTVAGLEASLRSLILTCTGPLTYMLLSFFVIGLHLYRGYEVIVPGGALIIQVAAEGNAGSLRNGDVVTMAGGERIGHASDLVQQLDYWKSGELQVQLLREQQPQQIILKRNLLADGFRLEKLGIGFRSLTENKHLGFLEAQWNSPYFTFKQAIGYSVSFWTNLNVSSWKVSSVFASMSLSNVLEVFGLLCFFFGVFNMLPLPLLPGGNVLTIGIEMLLGHSLSRHFKERLEHITFVAVLLFMAMVIGRDVLSFAATENSYKPRSKVFVSIVRWSGTNATWLA